MLYLVKLMTTEPGYSVSETPQGWTFTRPQNGGKLPYNYNEQIYCLCSGRSYIHELDPSANRLTGLIYSLAGYCFSSFKHFILRQDCGATIEMYKFFAKVFFEGQAELFGGELKIKKQHELLSPPENLALMTHPIISLMRFNPYPISMD